MVFVLWAKDILGGSHPGPGGIGLACRIGRNLLVRIGYLISDKIQASKQAGHLSITRYLDR